jgi:uncharacterized integral membrane protein (TIGR00698 family)
MIVLYVLTGLVITLPVTAPGLYQKKNLPGIALCLLIAVPAWFIGQAFPLAGGAVTGMLLGMTAANFIRIPKALTPGINAVSKRILQSAVLLLGFQMNLRMVLEQGGNALLLILAVISAALLTAVVIGRLLKVGTNEKILIGAGTAICGGSAVAAAGAVINSSEEETASAVSTIFLFNAAAVFIFPVLGRLLGMGDETFGAWAGAAINDTSSVAAASYAFSDAAGEQAVIVKLTRTLFIIPFTLGLAVYKQRKHAGQSARNGIKIPVHKIIPLFVIFFLLACIINTFNIIPTDFTNFWGGMSKFLITTAMTAIGLSTNLKTLIRNGGKPVVLGFCCWAAVAAAALVLI